jgi:hypothetical protein
MNGLAHFLGHGQLSQKHCDHQFFMVSGKSPFLGFILLQPEFL